MTTLLQLGVYLPFKYKIRLTMLCLSGVELYSRWVPLILYQGLAQSLEEMLGIVLVQG